MKKIVIMKDLRYNEKGYFIAFRYNLWFKIFGYKSCMIIGFESTEEELIKKVKLLLYGKVEFIRIVEV